MAKSKKAKAVKAEPKPEAKTGTCPVCKSTFLYSTELSCVDIYGKCAVCVADDGSLAKPATKPASPKLMRRK